MGVYTEGILVLSKGEVFEEEVKYKYLVSNYYDEISKIENFDEEYICEYEEEWEDKFKDDLFFGWTDKNYVVIHQHYDDDEPMYYKKECVFYFYTVGDLIKLLKMHDSDEEIKIVGYQW